MAGLKLPSGAFTYTWGPDFNPGPGSLSWDSDLLTRAQTQVQGPRPPYQDPDLYPMIRPQFRAPTFMAGPVFPWRDSDLHPGPSPTSGYLMSILGPDLHPWAQTRIPGPGLPTQDQTSIKGTDLHGRTPISMAVLKPPSGAFTYIWVPDVNPVAWTSILGPRPPCQGPSPHPGTQNPIPRSRPSSRDQT